MKPLVPSNPGPPKDPKSFWAPWPAIREPCTTRTIIGAASLTLEVFILTPSVAFSGLTTLVRQRRGRLPTLYTLDHPVYTLADFLSLCVRVRGRCQAIEKVGIRESFHLHAPVKVVPGR